MTIYESIARIMAEGYAVEKSQKNAQQGFLYRGIDDVMNTFQPLLAKHGVFVVPEVLDITREERQTTRGGNLIYAVLKVRYTFCSADGTSVSATVIGEGMDSGDKASNKAMAAAMKYAMFQVFCIPTEEMQDPDAGSHEVTAKAINKQATAKVPPVPERFTCADCGNVITPVTYKGVDFPVRRIADKTLQKYGRALCWDCAAKKGEEQNDAESENP